MRLFMAINTAVLLEQLSACNFCFAHSETLTSSFVQGTLILRNEDQIVTATLPCF